MVSVETAPSRGANHLPGVTWQVSDGPYEGPDALPPSPGPVQAFITEPLVKSSEIAGVLC